MRRISENYSFDRSKLSIEITEDTIERNREIAMRNILHCKKLGYKIYLDDMGSGYSSLLNLCDYPVDVVKIDRNILLKTYESKGKELFSGIVSLAHKLDMAVICEGVETEEQSQFVASAGCDFVQGWYYSKPIPAEECETFINNYNKATKKSRKQS